jgi:PilZ domain
MPSGRDRRRSERFPTASIPVLLSDIDGELIDLSQSGAAVIHRSPVSAGAPATLVFPSYGGIYIPCKVLRSLVQVRRAGEEREYVFRSAILFTEMEPEQREPLHEFLEIQIARLKEKQAEAAAAAQAT